MGPIMNLDFSKMKYNPDTDVLKKNPELEGIIGISDLKMVKYILLMYDEKSPMKDYYPDLEKRKDFCAALAGYDNVKDSDTISSLKSMTKEVKIPVGDPEDQKFKTSIEIWDEFVDAVLNYVTHQNSRLWAMIVTNEQAFYEYQRRVMAEVDGGVSKNSLEAISTKTKLLEAMDDIDRRLESYYNKLSGGDSAIEDMASRKRRTTAESNAKR